MDWITHEEDVWFDFRGNDPHQLTPGRFYRGEVDGFADFGVFVDLGSGVTGLLHRSELDRRLESLDWEEGDTVFVQVTNVRDNGNVDLGWSIRQSDSEFRGARIHDPGGENDGEPLDVTDESDEPVRTSVSDVSGPGAGGVASDEGDRDSSRGTEGESAQEQTQEREREAGEADATEVPGRTDVESSTEAQAPDEAENGENDADAGEQDACEETAPEATADRERAEIETLSDRVGDDVRIEGEVVGARQTGGPTVFEVRDETGVVDCAAFVEAGVRAYPEVEVGDAVRLDGEVELRRNELQVETEALTVLEGEEADTVTQRLEDAMTAKARPDDVTPLADLDSVEAVSEAVGDAAEAVRRAVLESRPVVVRHAATADGYVAGAAIERAVLPLVREEYAKADAEYHYFKRRPLDDTVYGMDAATNDVTRMLEDRDRHDEKLPLVVLVGTGSTAESLDGLELLGIYGAKRVVVDAAPADDEVGEEVEVLVNPSRGESEADGLSTGALAANVAAAVNGDVREDLSHLPAVSYWENAPEAYLELAEEAGYDADRVRELRESIALEAYYQSYQDKRELVTDLLFDGESAESEENPRRLASHVAEQFRIKLDDEVETAEANLDRREEGDVTFAVLDADSFTHRFDFPPTALLLDELHRRNRDDDGFVTIGVAMDELYVRSDADVDVRAVAERVREEVPDAGVTAVGVRQGRIEFLSGERDAVVDAVVDAVAAQLD